MGKNKRSDESEGTGALITTEEQTSVPPQYDVQAMRASTEKRRPLDWRKECGVPTWAHAAARTVHGWRQHRYHAGKPLQVTRDDYMAAIAAANDNTGEVKPHGPALSEHKGKGI